MSRIGLSLCALYAAAIGGCITLAYSGSGDFKGQFVFLQLPIAIQGALLQEIGLGPLLEKLNLVTAYIFIALPTFVFLYFTGWFISRLLFNPGNKRTPTLIGTITNPLSVERAVSTRNSLAMRGVSGSRIHLGGQGAYQPIASNATASSRAQNRRVEIFVNESSC